MPCSEIVTEVRSLNSNQDRQHYKTCYVYSPLQFSALVDVSAVHSRNTRSNSENNFYLEGRNLSFGLKTTSFAGPKIWNSLLAAAKNAQSLEIFKIKLKEYLMA